MEFDRIARNVWDTQPDNPCKVFLSKPKSRDHGKPQETFIAKVFGVSVYETSAPCSAIPSDMLKQWRWMQKDTPSPAQIQEIK